jgi:hypothetical protein
MISVWKNVALEPASPKAGSRETKSAEDLDPGEGGVFYKPPFEPLNPAFESEAWKRLQTASICLGIGTTN